MLGKSHRSVSETALLALCTHIHLPLPALLCLMAGTYFGSTAPDIDQPSSKFQRMLGPLGKVMSKCITHRTWTHTLWAISLVILLSILLPAPPLGKLIVYKYGLTLTPIRLIYCGYAFGYFMHCLEDSFSRQGVCWTYPLHKFNYYHGKPYKRGHKHFWYYRTGGTEETGIRWISNLLFIIFSTIIITQLNL